MSEPGGAAQWAGALADTLLKSGVWLGLAVLLLWAMRGETARARHRVCLFALGGLCFLPLLRGLPFAWKIPVSGGWAASISPVSPNHAASPNDAARPAVPARFARSMRRAAGGQVPPAWAAQKTADVTKVNTAEYGSTRPPGVGAVRNSNLTFAAPVMRVSRPGVFASRASTRRDPFLSGAIVLAGAWLAGFLPVMLHNLNGWRALRRLQRGSARVSGGRLADALTEAAHEIGGIQRPLRLRIGGQAGGFAAPMTWGWLRPVVWLPDSAEHWTLERARIVLLHETAHIRRGDWLWQTGAACLCALLWFHPLVWLLRRRLHTESERACDDCVLQTGVSAKGYAGHLLDVARTLKRARNAPPAAVTMARSSQIETRLKAILAPPPVSLSPWARLRARIAALALPAALLPLCAAQLTAAQARSSDTALAAIPRQQPHTPILQTARPILPPPVSNPAPNAAFAAHADAPNAAVSDQTPAPVVPAGKPSMQPSMQSSSRPAIQPSTKPSKPHLSASIGDGLTFPVTFPLPPAALLQNKPPVRPDKKQDDKAAQENANNDNTKNNLTKRDKPSQEDGGAEAQPADIEPDAARLLSQTAEAYSALTSLSLTIHSEQSPPMFGLTHADWNIQWKYPNRAILTCRNATGTAHTFADGSDLYVFSRRDTRRYARLPLRSNGTDAWQRIGQSAFDDGVTGLGYFTSLMRGENLLRLFGTQLRSLKLGAREAAGSEAVQNVLAEMEYRFTQPFARSQAPTVTHRSLLTFAIGVNDHLVRRVTIKALTPPGANGERLIESTQTFADIKINPELPDAMFAFTPPADLEAEDSVVNLGERNHAHYLKPGVAAPDFTARDINGKTVSLSQYRGKTVLLIFWTRDCGNTPWGTDDMAALYRKYHAKGLEIIGICDDYISRPATLPPFLAKHGMTWPQIRDGGRARGPIFRLYGVKGTTQAMLIGPDGKLLNPDVNMLPSLELQLEQLFHPSHL